MNAKCEPVLNVLEEKLRAAMDGESPEQEARCLRMLTDELECAIGASSPAITLSMITPDGEETVMPACAGVAAGLVAWGRRDDNDPRLPLFATRGDDAYLVIDGPDAIVAAILAQASPRARRRFDELSAPSDAATLDAQWPAADALVGETSVDHDSNRSVR